MEVTFGSPRGFLVDFYVDSVYEAEEIDREPRADRDRLSEYQQSCQGLKKLTT